MDRENFVQLLARIYATREKEIGCEDAQTLLPTYVDIEIAGGNPGEPLPQVKAHLRQCSDCAEEYEGLRLVAAREAQGRLAQAGESLVHFEARPTKEWGGPVESLPAGISHRESGEPAVRGGD